MPLTDQERVDFEALASGQISDAMESLGLRRSVVTGLMMLASPGAKMNAAFVRIGLSGSTTKGGAGYADATTTAAFEWITTAPNTPPPASR